MALTRPGAGEVEAVDLEARPLGPWEVSVRVLACGVCRTDLHVVDGDLPDPPIPIVPGHEIVGRIEALGEQVRGPVQTGRDEYERCFRKLIEDGVGEGLFRPLDSKVAALALLGAVNWTVRWFRPGGGRSALDIGCEQAEILVRGLLAPGQEVQAPPPDLLDTLATGEKE